MKGENRREQKTMKENEKRKKHGWRENNEK